MRNRRVSNHANLKYGVCSVEFPTEPVVMVRWSTQHYHLVYMNGYTRLQPVSPDEYMLIIFGLA